MLVILFIKLHYIKIKSQDLYNFVTTIFWVYISYKIRNSEISAKLSNWGIFVLILLHLTVDFLVIILQSILTLSHLSIPLCFSISWSSKISLCDFKIKVLCSQWNVLQFAQLKCSTAIRAFNSFSVGAMQSGDLI